jgi:HSP20 family protein
MLYRSLFPRDLFAEFDRLQRDLHGLVDDSPSIRGLGRGGYPALNVGSTPTSVEVFAFAPGLDPAAIEVNLDRGVLTLSGKRPGNAAADARTTQHLEERFAGAFTRVVSLPEDIDPDAVSARYRDGVLHISVQRRAATQPRRIDVH